MSNTRSAAPWATNMPEKEAGRLAPKSLEALLADLGRLKPGARLSYIKDLTELDVLPALVALKRKSDGAGYRESIGGTETLLPWLQDIRKTIERDALRPVELLAQLEGLIADRAFTPDVRCSDRLANADDVVIFHPYLQPFHLWKGCTSSASSFSFVPKTTWTKLEDEALRSMDYLRKRLVNSAPAGADEPILEIFEDARAVHDFNALSARYDVPGSMSPTLIVHASNRLLDVGLGTFLSTVACPLLLRRWLASCDRGGTVVHDPVVIALDRRIKNLLVDVDRATLDSFWARVDALEVAPTVAGDVELDVGDAASVDLLRMPGNLAPVGGV